MKQIVIIELLVLFLVCLRPVLAANLTVANPLYIGKEGSTTCVLSAFSATVTVKPASPDTPEKPSFLGGTFNISPETSSGQIASCKPDLIRHYYRFNDTFNKTSLHQSLFSIGFEIGVGRSVEIHFKYVEVVCDVPNGCIRSNLKYCSDEGRAELKPNCIRMWASFPLVWLKEGQTYQCSHNSFVNLKDVSYYNDVRVFRGRFEMDLDYIRIDVTNSTETFHPIKYCLMDWLLDMNIIIIVSSIVCLILLSIVCKCVYDCRRDAKRRKYRTNQSQRLNECQKEAETEKLGPIVDL